MQRSATKALYGFIPLLLAGFAAARASVFPAAPFGLEVAWKRPLGSGYSEVVVAGNSAVTMYSDAESNWLEAFDPATGTARWKYKIGPLYKGHDGSDDGPTSTPVIADGTVYGLDPHGRLFAVALTDGKELWAKTLNPETEAPAPKYGFAARPVVAGEALVVLTGRPPGAAVTGYSRRDGKTLWTAGDDTVAYQSPIVAKIAGEEQIVALTDTLLLGLSPKDGKILWQHRHTTESPGGIASPVALGDGRFLVLLDEDAAAFQVSKSADGFGVSELWRSREFQNTFAMPLFHDGYLYGFTGRFLTCLDAATGKQVWKSRPPGGQSVNLVDGNLVAISGEGEVVVAEASPAGYREKARIKALERSSLSRPAQGGGLVLVRDLKEVAGLRPTAGVAKVDAKAAGPDLTKIGGDLGALLTRLEAADPASRKGLTDEFLAGRELPIREADGTVHFLYRGEAQDVAVSGNVNPGQDEVPLERVPGTDLFLRTTKLEPKGVYEYQYRINFGDPAPDAGNPNRFQTRSGEASELRMPGFVQPAHLADPGSRPRGRVDTQTFASKARGNERKIQIYLPPGYDAGSRRYPLLILNNGDQHLNFGKLGNTLDNLIGTSVEPLIVAFVPRLPDENGSGTVRAYGQMIAEEVVPFLDRTYRTEADTKSRGIGGIGGGAGNAAYAAFKYPGTFGRLMLQSFFFDPDLKPEILAAINAGSHGIRSAFVELRKVDVRFGDAIDARASSEELRKLLGGQGVTLSGGEVPSPPGWASWRATANEWLTALYPLAARR